MKFVVLLAILAVVYLVWSAGKRKDAAAARAAARRPAGTPGVPQDMVRCPVCALHLPRSDALPGRSGRLYCSREHLAAGGD